uniref:Uncharacterized protein n=1 Tax=Arundo donax TaxID=35708 RepID=A0A0A8ZGS6_ARUDO
MRFCWGKGSRARGLATVRGGSAN